MNKTEDMKFQSLAWANTKYNRSDGSIYSLAREKDNKRAKIS
jgi:hypothetical protein